SSPSSPSSTTHAIITTTPSNPHLFHHHLHTTSHCDIIFGQPTTATTSCPPSNHHHHLMKASTKVRLFSSVTKRVHFGFDTSTKGASAYPIQHQRNKMEKGVFGYDKRPQGCVQFDFCTSKGAWGFGQTHKGALDLVDSPTERQQRECLFRQLTPRGVFGLCTSRGCVWVYTPAKGAYGQAPAESAFGFYIHQGMSEAIRFIGTTRNFYVEMGKNNDGFQQQIVWKLSQDCTSKKLSPDMACQYLSSQIVIVISHLDSGNHCRPEIIHEITKKIMQNLTTLASCKRPAEELCQQLPEELSNVYSTFHISNLKKCLSDESLVIPIKELQLDDKLNFVEEPVEVMDREVKQQKQSRIPIVKVRWNSKRGPKFTWEREDQSRAKSLCDYIQEQAVTTSGNAKSLWDHLKNLFHDNKDARAINLDNELRFIKIRKMTVNEYYTKIQAMTNRLKNLDCEVSEKNMVIFAVNGLILVLQLLLKSFVTVNPSSHLKRSCDLYPVTKSSNLPVAFVSTSSSTWPQYLGHPRGEVLCSLTSCCFISCNKEKSLYVCHACQLGKHVKLPLHSSDSIVTKCFVLFILIYGPLSFNQQHGVDFDETFSLVVKPATIRTILSLAVSRQWPIHQLDVKNAFLNSDLSETLYMYQPPGFVDSRFVTWDGFSSSRCDSSLFIYTQGSQVAYLLIYVDDIILIASSPFLLQQIVDSLHKEFDMTDLGGLNYILGISVICYLTGLFLSQKKYALQLLEHAHMVVTHLSYAIQQICLYMHDPRGSHFAALKRIPRYVQGTLELGLHLYAFTTTSLVGYTNPDWAGCPSTRRSTSSYCVFLGDNLLLWSAKRQHTISRSSAEAEYQGVANIVAETAWLCNLLCELHSLLLNATLVYCDKAGHVWVLHVPSCFRYADIFTNGLPSALFEDFHSSLSVRPPPAQTTGAY
nr:hypothetical protein [Tanacetum cinerariifolium]